MLLLGLLSSLDSNVTLTSNRESGEGYPDIMIYNSKTAIGSVIEVKATKKESELTRSAELGLTQCQDRGYAPSLARDHQLNTVYVFGIAFCRKKCCVKLKTWKN